MSTQTGGCSAAKTQDYTPNRGTTPQGGNSIFIDQSESIVATIGSNYLQNFLSGGSVGKSVGVLTQKRFYYKEQSYGGVGKSSKSDTEQGVVSIEDITFAAFTHTRHMGFLITAILLTLCALFILVTSSGAPSDGVPIILSIVSGILVAALPFYILYFVKRQTLFQIAFPGGSFSFDIRWYPISDIQNFQRQLLLLKDQIKNG